MVECIQVTTTTPSRDDALRIAEALTRARLAACVQIVGPISSVYWWQGELQTSEEWLCLIKTQQRLFDQVTQQIEGLHPYELPEVLATTALASPKYGEWLAGELRPDG